MNTRNVLFLLVVALLTAPMTIAASPAIPTPPDPGQHVMIEIITNILPCFGYMKGGGIQSQKDVTFTSVTPIERIEIQGVYEPDFVVNVYDTVDGKSWRFAHIITCGRSHELKANIWFTDGSYSEKSYILLAQDPPIALPSYP